MVIKSSLLFFFCLTKMVGIKACSYFSAEPHTSNWKFYVVERCSDYFPYFYCDLEVRVIIAIYLLHVFKPDIPYHFHLINSNNLFL